MTEAIIGADFEGASAGRLSAGGRSAATATALPLLATYFADAPTWELRSQAQVAGEGIDELARYVRMRVAIASAGRLESILRRVGSSATFQYAQFREESVGAIRGKLDVPRYVRSRLRAEAPRRYPVRILRRAFATPENILAAHAALIVTYDLTQAPVRLLPKGSPERVAIARAVSTLGHLLRQSNLAEAATIASTVRNRGQRQMLIDRVASRVRGGHIAKPEPYADLLTWIHAFGSEQGSAAAGVVEWAFYDERFDTKLFEIWSLRLLIDSVTGRLGPPVLGPSPLFERDRAPIAAWRAAGATVRVFFQASFERTGLGPTRWTFTVPERRSLTGIPDISLALEMVGGMRLVALVDPKLRIRDGAPAEELYKLIGYFGNSGTGQSPLGGIVFYAPSQPRLYLLEAEGRARIAAIGVDPAMEPESRARFNELVDMLLNAVGLDADLTGPMAMIPSDPESSVEEVVTTARQMTAVEAMSRQAAGLPAGSLEPFKREVAGLLEEAWIRLDDDTARMIATAEYFGMTAPDDADHSGPLLGLAATCERVLYLRLLDPVRMTHRREFADVKTLGATISCLRDALGRAPRTDAGRALAAEIASRGLDHARLAELEVALHQMNIRYRIPAAHRELVDQNLWQTGRLSILRPGTGLLRQLLDVLASD